MASYLYATATGCSNLLSVNVQDSHTAATSTATIICESSSLDVGDTASIYLGYTGNNAKVFEGYVKNVVHQQSPDQYEITCANVMIRAVDYFIAASNPEEPFSRENIAAEDLVGDLMALAGLTDYDGHATSFTFMTQGEPLEINLTSVYDYCKFIADILAWHIYADIGGTVHFLSRPPFPDGDSSSATYGNSEILSVGHYRSDRDLRNRVVVYGSEGIYAEASASSPYLPANFYKTVVVAAPTVIDTQQMAQDSADYNLAKLNRLTVGGQVSIIGDPNIAARDCVTITKADIGMTGLWYVYGCEHDWGKEGYKTNLDLRQ